MDLLLPIERRVTEILSPFPSRVRSGVVHVLTLESSEERARTIGCIWEAHDLRPLANLLIDLEAEPTARALVAEMLLEQDRWDEA